MTQFPGTFGFASASSFGTDNTTFRATDFIRSERFMDLDRKESYFSCTQHDWKRFDFDGRIIRPGPPTMQPLLSSEAAPYYVPLKMRRPADPYRLAPVIVNSFTNLLFGDGRWPQTKVARDEQSQAFVNALVKAQRLPLRMIEARNIGGSTGSVGISWCYYNGRPKCEVHNPKHIVIHKWADRDELIPEYVSEVYRFYRDEWNPEKRILQRVWYWSRRDWTPNFDVVYLDVPFGEGEPVFVPDPSRTVEHNDGECHFVWIQNTPSKDMDGTPDYDNLYENLDTMDVLNSILSRGAILNLDPTLVLRVDKEVAMRKGVAKGSDNALYLNKDETADYLELGGTSIGIGQTLLDSKRRYALEVAQCVVIDPNTVASQGVSSVSIKAMYSAMLAKGDILREQYGDGIRRLLDSQLRVARKQRDRLAKQNKRAVFALPLREISAPVLDPVTDSPTGETTVAVVQQEPGNGTEIDLVWGPYFKPTPDDQQKAVTTAVMATGGKPVLSPKSAIAVVAQTFGLNADTEEKLIQDSKQGESLLLGNLMDEAGGKVEKEGQLPPGARERQPGLSSEGGEEPPEEEDPVSQA